MFLDFNIGSFYFGEVFGDFGFIYGVVCEMWRWLGEKLESFGVWYGKVSECLEMV